MYTFLLFPSPAQSGRGVALWTGATAEEVVIGVQYALIIGINEYLHYPVLMNPVFDAKTISEVLTSRYIIDEVIELYDALATRDNIFYAFTTLQEIYRIPH